MQYKVLAIYLGLGLWSSGALAQEATIGVRDRCLRVKAIAEAAQCIEKGCPDPDGKQKEVYEYFCRAPEEGDGNNGEVKEPRPAITEFLENNSGGTDGINANFASRRNVLRPAQPTGRLLEPCECLAMWDKKVKEAGLDCPVELCKPPEVPKEPEQPKIPDTPKEVTPDTPKEQKGPQQFLFEGSGCSLGFAGGLLNLSGWAVVLLAPLGWALSRKRK